MGDFSPHLGDHFLGSFFQAFVGVLGAWILDSALIPCCPWLPHPIPGLQGCIQSSPIVHVHTDLPHSHAVRTCEAALEPGPIIYIFAETETQEPLCWSVLCLSSCHEIPSLCGTSVSCCTCRSEIWQEAECCLLHSILTGGFYSSLDCPQIKDTEPLYL